MHRLSALALATATLAGAPQAQAQVLTWPAKRDEAAATRPNAQPLMMGVPRESRYSPRRAAPTMTTRAASSVIVQAPAATVAEVRRTTRAAPVLPAPAATARVEAPVQRAVRPAYEAPAPVVAAEKPRRSTRPQRDPAQAFASLPTKPVVPPPAAAPAQVDPEWTVREEMMSRVPPAPAKTEAPAEREAAAPVPVKAAAEKAEVKPSKKAKSKAAPAEATAQAQAPATKTAVATAAAVKPAAPKEPWRNRSAEDGPRFYSLHRQFGFTPDQARAAAPNGAAAEPLPSAFFLSAAPEEAAEEDEAEAEQRGRDAEKARQAGQKKKGRRK